MNTFTVTLDDGGMRRTYLMKADTFDEVFYHVKQDHPECQIVRIEVIVADSLATKL